MRNVYPLEWTFALVYMGALTFVLWSLTELRLSGVRISCDNPRTLSLVHGTSAVLAVLKVITSIMGLIFAGWVWTLGWSTVWAVASIVLIQIIFANWQRVEPMIVRACTVPIIQQKAFEP